MTLHLYESFLKKKKIKSQFRRGSNAINSSVKSHERIVTSVSKKIVSFTDDSPRVCRPLPPAREYLTFWPEIEGRRLRGGEGGGEGRRGEGRMGKRE